MSMCLAVPGRVLSIEGDEALLRTGRVAFGGIVKEVSLAYVSEVTLGDFVLVHAGFAITVLDTHEAQRSLAYLREMAGTEDDGRMGG